MTTIEAMRPPAEFKTIDVKVGHRQEPLLRSDKISKQILSFAQHFNTTLGSDENGLPPVFIYLAKGAKPFANSLSKSLAEVSEAEQHNFHPVKYTFYDGTTRLDRPRRVDKKKYTYPDISGRRVIFLDDIHDTGETAAQAMRDAEEMGAKVSDFIFLLEKPATDGETKVRTVEWPVGIKKHVLFTIPNLWVEGFGLDTNGRGRRNKNIIVRWDKMFPQQSRLKRLFTGNSSKDK